MKFFTEYMGFWHGSGTSFGQKLTGKLHIYTECQDGFFVIEESLFESNGSLQYEDCSWIHSQNPRNDNEWIGYHFTPGGNVQRFMVIQKDGFHNFHCWAGPLVPVVYYKMYENKLIIDVLDVEQNLVHQMVYKRA